MYPIELPARLVLLPGMGANPRMFGPQKRVFGDALITPDWIKPKDTDSIGDLAVGWAQVIRDQLDPADDRPLIVGGASLGGMIALEMAGALGAEAVILIGSARESAAVPATSRLADWVGRLVPKAMMSRAMLAGLVPLAVAEDLDDDDFALFKQMADEVDTDVLRWSHGAVADWEFACDATKPGVPIYQIHGQKDRVLPRSSEADVVVPGGHHMINLTHAQTVNRFIVDSIEKQVGVTALPVI